MRTVKEIKEDIAKDIQNMDNRRVIDMYRAEIVFGIAIDRLEEICNAEREGNLRIVTLCKNCHAWKKYPEGSGGYCDKIQRAIIIAGPNNVMTLCRARIEKAKEGTV